MRTLEKLTIENFKSIRHQVLELGSLNVFIGANGAGKSNLVQGFRFLHEILNKNLAGYTASKGGADSLLYLGRKRSKEMLFHLEFGEGGRSNAYRVTLQGTAEDSLVVALETAFYHERKMYPSPWNMQVSSFSKESKLRDTEHICTRQVVRDLESYRVYHFHDTSDTAGVKGTADVDDNRYLRAQAENLAPFLYWMQEKRPEHFRNIQDTIRQIAPFFERFQLGPSRLNPEKIRLEWRQKGSESYFNATALSDGTLRFMCLATLLLQPDLPALVLLDEPELGLHPAAITLLADLLSSASTRTQVVIATQSVTLVNHFQPEQVWAVDRRDEASEFHRLSEDDMSEWFDDFALGELWEKNVLGARP